MRSLFRRFLSPGDLMIVGSHKIPAGGSGNRVLSTCRSWVSQREKPSGWRVRNVYHAVVRFPILGLTQAAATSSAFDMGLAHGFFGS